MAKPSINAPTKDTDDPLCHNECRLALEPSLTSLAEAATKVGWPPVMVAYSLMILSAQMLEKHGCLVVGKMERLALKTGLDTWNRMQAPPSDGVS